MENYNYNPDLKHRYHPYFQNIYGNSTNIWHHQKVPSTVPATQWLVNPIFDYSIFRNYYLYQNFFNTGLNVNYNLNTKVVIPTNDSHFVNNFNLFPFTQSCAQSYISFEASDANKNVQFENCYNYSKNINPHNTFTKAIDTSHKINFNSTNGYTSFEDGKKFQDSIFNNNYSIKLNEIAKCGQKSESGPNCNNDVLLQNQTQSKDDKNAKINKINPEKIYTNAEDKKIGKMIEKVEKIIKDKYDKRYTDFEYTTSRNKRTNHTNILKENLRNNYVTYDHDSLYSNFKDIRNIENYNHPVDELYTTEILDDQNWEVKHIKDLITSSNVVVHTIEKICNNTLIEAYHKTKEKKLREFGDIVRECLLFHGTKWSHIDNICRKNFDKSLAIAHKFGHGVNFSPNAHYASNYSNFDMRVKAMVLAIVLVSRSYPGHPDMTEPPAGFDTTHGKDGMVIVKYEDHAFYPAYILHYRLRNEEGYFARVKKQKKLKRLQKRNRSNLFV